MTKTTFFERPMCRIAGDSVTWKSLILFLGFTEFGVIAQTRGAGGVAQTRNYGVT